MHTNDDARSQELQMRDITERNQHLTAFFQQVAYVLLVASGALMISKGELSMGALIACSILSGRVLQPVAMIPAQLVQWASVKASLQSLDRIWQLEDDHHGVEHPLTPEAIQGGYKLEKVSASYGGPVKAVNIAQLVIQPGEKIGVLGPIGAGKTTLLRLLSGMYKPQEGRVLLDQLDMAHISKPVLAEHVGFLQQEGRLFAGSLRDNLILGLIDPGDDAILAAALAEKSARMGPNCFTYRIIFARFNRACSELSGAMAASISFCTRSLSCCPSASASFCAGAA
jgi:ATP-binding cassette subfamily C protein LapB